MKTTIIALSFFIVSLVTGKAEATLFGFDSITNNNSTDAAIGEQQLFVDISLQSDGVLFYFSNIGTDSSAITDVYFDDISPGAYFSSIFAINEGDGVDFESGANPGDLPGGNPFNFSANYSADSEPAVQPNGVNPGEYLGITLALANPDSFSFDSLLTSLGDRSFSIGIHVQGFDSEGSESFVNNPAPVPEPETLLLLGIGLLGLTGVKLRGNKHDKDL